MVNPFQSSKLLLRVQQVATFLFLVYVLVLLGRSAWTNAERNEQNQLIREQIADLERQTAELDELIAYQSTTTFKELEARRTLGVKKTGEIVLALPPEPDTPIVTAPTEVTTISTRDTLRAWWDYYFAAKN